MGIIISGLTGGHNTDSPSKEIAVFYDLALLYNVKRFRAPGNRTPLTTLQFFLVINANLKIQPDGS